jgi:hypothetical protein
LVANGDLRRRLEWSLFFALSLINMTKSAAALDAFTQLAAKVDAAIKDSPLSGLEKNARQHLVSKLAQQGLVTQEEFEIQRALLEKTRAKLIALEQRVADLERKLAADGK